MTIELAEALYQLRQLRPDELGDVGVELLQSGHDTQAIRELAALDASATWRDVGDLFTRVLRDLERPPVADIDAAYIVAEAIAEQIVGGEVSPYEGAARIGSAAWRQAGMPDDLTGFYYWADEWEDHPEYRDACEQDIMNEARAFLVRRRAPAT